MRILVITQFSVLGGSSRIQVIQFFPFFTRAGISYAHHAVYTDRFFRIQNGLIKKSSLAKKINFAAGMLAGFVKKAGYVFAAGRYDAVLIQREVFPRSWYWLMRKMNPRIIYEIEDTIFEINEFWRRGRLHETALRYQARMCRNMMRYAAEVIAENEYLAAEARKHHSRVSLLTAPINTDIFVPLPSQAARESLRRGTTIGWIGSPGTSYLLKTIAPALAAVCQRHPDVSVKIVGAASDFVLPGVRTEQCDWDAGRERADLQSFDIGLMPLDDAPFNRGRLGYKMIQYMAVGIPVVASDIGLNKTVIRNGENGFLAGSNEEWNERLLLLITSPDLRRRLGAAGRHMAEERFSLARQAEHLITIIRHCARESASDRDRKDIRSAV